MPISISLPPRRRTRVLTFRISEEEYSAIVGACASRGDCVSEFARAALLERVYSEPGPEERMRQLSERLARLGDRMEGVLDRFEAREGLADEVPEMASADPAS